MMTDDTVIACEHKNTRIGYGLAGGGIGVYEYCEDCDEILSKTQDSELVNPLSGTEATP